MILFRFFFRTAHQANPITIIASAMTKKIPDRMIPPTNGPFILVGILTKLVGELVAMVFMVVAMVVMVVTMVVGKELRTKSSSTSTSTPVQ